ncbi:lipin [Thraustotheca clavata]|uniref:Lipin n=1 Tax=Thraustotheca clavata TaxID=74557 RepID=A0A1V9ZVQ0_9STRA|nr:lipin [Thraustotheca clavata]
MSTEDDDAYSLFGPPREQVDDSFEELFPVAPTKQQIVEEEDNPLFPQKRGVESLPNERSPAPTVPTYRSTEEFKKSGNAIDIILVRNENGTTMASTPWHVAFSYSRFSSNNGTGEAVDVLLNGQKLPLPMLLNDKGRCAFPSGEDTPPEDIMQFINEIIPLKNPPLFVPVRFEHRKRYSSTVRFVECRMYLWGPDDSAVVADLDGTITISDIEGHIRTLRLGQYDFIHKGACGFYSKFQAIGLKILYLTARPIHWADASREHLDQAQQAPYRLPPGPLITNSSGYTGALIAEVINKNPNVFKENMLNTIQLACIHGGRRSSAPVFVAGFGNRPTDVLAYEAVGIDGASIFLIDPSSNLKAVKGAQVFESYSDPQALLWLLPKIKLKVPLAMQEIIDRYIANEIVEAEERKAIKAQELKADQPERTISSSRTLSSSSSSSRSYTRSTSASQSSSYSVYASHPNRTEL